MSLRGIFLIFGIVALSACASSYTAAPSSTLASVGGLTPAALDYMPVNNLAQYEAYSVNPLGDEWWSQQAVLSPLTPNKNCARVIKGNIGDLQVDPWNLLVDPSLGLSATSYVVTKDAGKNVYIVGSVDLQTGVETCHKPGLWVKSQMHVGETWTFRNIFGDLQIAQVIEYLPTAPFLYYDPNTNEPATATYNRVFEIQYGSYFMIYWAPGYGAVHAVSTYPGVQYPYVTAFNWARSTPTPSPQPSATPTP